MNKVVVLYGSVPESASLDEQDALIEAAAVSGALAALGYEPVTVAFSLDLVSIMNKLHEIRPAFAFNIVESVAGQGRLIHLAPALLDYLRLPYTGARTDAQYATSNKLLAKRLLQGSGLPTPDWVILDGKEGPGLPEPYNPYIIKSVWEHASVGLDDESVILPNSPSELCREMERRRGQLGGECFAEAYVDGREFNLALLAGKGGPEVLPPAEILFDGYPEHKHRIVGYRAKWDAQSFEYNHTPRRFNFPATDSALLEQVVKLAQGCWRLFNLRGYARVDFRVDHDGKPWILEINANPCISPDSGFVAAAHQAGLSYEQIIERIIASN